MNNTKRLLRRFLRHKLGVFGAAFLLLLILLTLLAPVITKGLPNKASLSEIYKPPSASHIFGTDQLGRDVFTRVLYGARVSLQVGVVSVLIQLTVGVVLGSLSAIAGRWVDVLLQRLVEVFLGFPFLIIVLVLSSIIGGSQMNIILIIGLVGWPPICRLIRGEILSLREQPFFEAARAYGISMPRLIGRHVLPNIVAPALVAATLNCANAILIEAQISFLGFGIQPPTATWGNMLMTAGQVHILESKPWIWLAPGIAVVLTILSLNFLGDALRDAFDPKYYI